MNHITWKEVLNKISEDSEINFIAEVMTPLHVLGVEALVMHLEETGVKCKGFILVVAHAKNGIIVSDNAFHQNCYKDVRAYILEDDEEHATNKFGFYFGLKRAEESRPPLYYASPFRPSFNKIPQVMSVRKGHNLHVVITEEGTASYLTTPYSLTTCRSIGWKIKDYIRYILESMIRDRFYEYRLDKTGKLERFLLLKKNGESYVRNTECAEQFAKMLETSKPDTDVSVYEGAVIFLPSLLHEDGITTERCDIPIYLEVQKIIGEGSYIVKPHPREKSFEAYNELKCFVEKESKISAEEIIARLSVKPRCVVGDTGTALVNVAALYGIKAIAINRLIDKKYLRQKDYFDGYDDVFRDVLIIPGSYDELRNCLEDL